MKLLIVSATPFEIGPLQNHLEEQFNSGRANRYEFNDLEVDLLITGVGMPLTAYALSKHLQHFPYNLVVNAGVAGTFKQELSLGTVVQVVSERFGDLGVEETDGSFSSVHQMGLINANQFPFMEGNLVNAASQEFDFLPKVHGISVNKVHGNKQSIERIKKDMPADVESMEGAAIFYICLLENIPFVQIRSISNYVEERNKENWDLPLAINNLNEVLIELLNSLIPE